MKHLKSIEEFKAVNEQLFGDYGKKLSNALFGDPNDQTKTGTSPISGSITNIPVSGDKAKNVQALMDAMKRHGITNPYTQKAILGTVGKESGFIPQNETSYRNTSNDRIRKIFGKRITVSDAELETIKKDDVRFYDMVYGQAATKNFGWNTGNTAPGDGYKYRGRGFNGITFKSLYQKYQDMLNKDNKLGRTVDIVNNPDQLNEIDVAAEAAVLFFISGAKNDVMQRKYGTKDINAFTDQNTALKGIVNINAGLGNDVSGTYLGGLEKATAIANQFNISTTGVSNMA
jgi:putative chitinase